MDGIYSGPDVYLKDSNRYRGRVNELYIRDQANSKLKNVLGVQPKQFRGIKATSPILREDKAKKKTSS